MSNIGATGAFAGLGGMSVGGVEQRAVEAFTKRALARATSAQIVLTGTPRFVARCSHKLWDLLAAAKLGEQSQDLEVQPDESDHQAECAVPFHILRRTGVRGILDEVEIEHE